MQVLYTLSNFKDGITALKKSMNQDLLTEVL